MTIRSSSLATVRCFCSELYRCYNCVQSYTDSEGPMKLIKPTLGPSISLLVNLWSNEAGRIHCARPYRKEDNVALDTKTILTFFFMSYDEQRQKKKHVDATKVKNVHLSHSEGRTVLEHCLHHSDKHKR
jgi:hypothetical protein